MSNYQQRAAEMCADWARRGVGPVAPAIAAALEQAAADAERRGYERGRRDFQFAPEGDNHHNAALCPYCSPSADAIEAGTT